MLTAAQLGRINHIRTSAGRNAVTMEQAEILIDQMNETDRTRAILVISKDEPLKPVQTCQDRIAAAVAAERERCAQIASLACGDYPANFNLQRSGAWIEASDLIERKIRSGL